MQFLRLDPPGHLNRFVREFWIIENPITIPEIQKVIPDGYCEIIFHYGDPFRIKLQNAWELQERMLFSGQISRYFYLENTGWTGILGIKLIPQTPAVLFDLSMDRYTDKVVPLKDISLAELPNELSDPGIDPDNRIAIASRWLEKIMNARDADSRMDDVVNSIFESHGMLDIESLAKIYRTSGRHLQREFKRQIGLTPKYFSRIIQFNYIFEALKARDRSWVDVALNSGYFDQSHFIANFKAFTGESPAEYGFDEQNLANFFLRR